MARRPARIKRTPTTMDSPPDLWEERGRDVAMGTS
jgi:hypothetical protein